MGLLTNQSLRGVPCALRESPHRCIYNQAPRSARLLEVVGYNDSSGLRRIRLPILLIFTFYIIGFWHEGPPLRFTRGDC